MHKHQTHHYNVDMKSMSMSSRRPRDKLPLLTNAIHFGFTITIFYCKYIAKNSKDKKKFEGQRPKEKVESKGQKKSEGSCELTSTAKRCQSASEVGASSTKKKNKKKVSVGKDTGTDVTDDTPCCICGKDTVSRKQTNGSSALIAHSGSMMDVEERQTSGIIVC